MPRIKGFHCIVCCNTVKPPIVDPPRLGHSINTKDAFQLYWDTEKCPDYRGVLSPGSTVLYIVLYLCSYLPGAKERCEIMEAFNNIYPILKKFKKT